MVDTKVMAHWASLVLLVMMRSAPASDPLASLVTLLGGSRIRSGRSRELRQMRRRAEKKVFKFRLISNGMGSPQNGSEEKQRRAVMASSAFRVW